MEGERARVRSRGASSASTPLEAHEMREHWWESETAGTTFMRTRSVSNPPAPVGHFQATSSQWYHITIVMMAYATYYTLMSGNLTVASLAAENLGAKKLATMPIVAMFIGAVLFVVPASLTMKRLGRRRSFILGGLAAVFSGATAFVALKLDSFALFLVAGLLLGIFDGFADYLRFAAAETVAASFQGHAVSIALCGGAVCSVLGPELARIATSANSESEGFMIYYLAATGVGLFFCCVSSLMQATPPCLKGSGDLQESLLAASRDSKTREAQSALESVDDGTPEAEMSSIASSTSVRLDLPPRSLRGIVTTPECLTAVVCGMAAQWCMVLMMTGLPLAMVDAYNYSFQRYALTIQIHLLGMFVPGLCTGYLADRWGVMPVFYGGLSIFAGSLIVGLWGTQFWNFLCALLFLGIAWNLLSVGSTKLLLASHTDAEAATAQAFFEFWSFVANGGASFVAGYTMHIGGWHQLLWATVPGAGLALLAVLALTSRGGVRNYREAVSTVHYHEGYNSIAVEQTAEEDTPREATVKEEGGRQTAL